MDIVSRERAILRFAHARNNPQSSTNPTLQRFCSPSEAGVACICLLGNEQSNGAFADLIMKFLWLSFLI